MTRVAGGHRLLTSANQGWAYTLTLMDPERFWQLIEQADTPGALHELLGALPEPDLVAFERLHDEAVDRAYDWGVWGAAYVINGGCGDDTFMDFRAYLVSLGRAIYEAALADPDSLAEVEISDDDDDGRGRRGRRRR